MVTAVAIIAALALVVAPKAITSAQSGDTSDWQAIAEQRGLTEADLRAAVMTYTPSGVMDEYVMFASAGQGGQVLMLQAIRFHQNILIVLRVLSVVYSSAPIGIFMEIFLLALRQI